MTDDKLREACERVAKKWLGWEIRTEPRCKPQWYTGPEFYNTPHAINRPGSSVLWPEEITRLASPKGMDLLLDAVEADGRFWWDCEYNPPRTICNADPIYSYRIGYYYKDSTCDFGNGEDSNRYAALIYALDKVEVL